MAETNETIENAVDNPEMLPWNGPSGLRALRSRDFALYWIGQLVSAIGSWMQNMAQGLLVYDLTHSPFYLGLVTTIGTIPITLLSLPAGVLADRWNKRRIVLITQTAFAFNAIALACMTYSGVVRPWHILIFAAISGTLNAIDIPARQTMLVEIVGKDDLPNAMALNSSAFNGARIIGPSVAGVVVAAGGTALCFLINGISFLAIIGALALVRASKFRTASETKPVMSEIKEGLVYARRNPLILELLIMTAITSVFALQYSSQLPAYGRTVLKLGDAPYGLLVAAAGIGSLIGGVAMAALGDMFKQRTVAVVGSFVLPAGILLVSFTRSFPAGFIGLALAGFGGMFYMISNNTMIQMASPDALRGRIISLRTFMFMGLAPAGAFALGTAAQHLGVQPALRYGALVCAAAALYFALRPGSDENVC
jgi:MFS family permease